MWLNYSDFYSFYYFQLYWIFELHWLFHLITHNICFYKENKKKIAYTLSNKSFAELFFKVYP